MLTDLAIAAPDPALAGQVQQAIDIKTKPPGSLGRIERLALQLAIAQGTEAPSADPAHLLICAGDHGMVNAGVSAWPQEVTGQMVLNFLSGGAAANVFARTSDVRIWVADAGVATDLPDSPDLKTAGIRKGTRNAIVEDALTPEEVDSALRFGADLARSATANGARVIAIGEMGIGNTASASLLGHAIAGLDLPSLVGPGAGLDPSGVEKKKALLAKAAARRPGRLAPLDALAAFGGLEIATMAGAVIGAASEGAAILVDGFISTSAVLAALTARPDARHAVIFAHRSAEPGHRMMLQALDAEALLDLDMRLGEGTGALLALPLLRASCAMLAEMATFESAGVSGKE